MRAGAATKASSCQDWPGWPSGELWPDLSAVSTRERDAQKKLYLLLPVTLKVMGTASPLGFPPHHQFFWRFFPVSAP